MTSTEGTNTPGNDQPNDSLNFEELVPWQKEMLEEKLPDRIIFPEELNLFLRHRIRDLTSENGCLRRALEEIEEKNFKKESETAMTQAPMIFGKPNQEAATKIIELSKKCREQTAEIQFLKFKRNSLQETLASKEAELENERYQSRCTNANNPSGGSTANSETKDDEDRVKYLTEKLQQTQTKLYESKNTCASLKQEINKAQKLLSSEVGENVSIISLSNQPGGWRGRAEQIRLLQLKVTELQTRLSDYEGAQKGSIVSVERKNLANLRAAEKERRQQIENSARELRQAEVAIEGYKRKLEASKARIKVLEYELNMAKGNVAILNEKRSHDEHLIETLNSRLKSAELKYQEREADIRNREEKIEREYINLKNEIQSGQLQIDRLQMRLEEREIEIDKLRSGVVPNAESIKSQKMYQSEIRSNKARDTSPPHNSSSSSNPNEYVTLALAAESERERLLELITMLNRRLDKERIDADILSDSLRNERIRTAKLELKLRKIETERVGIVKVDSGYKSKFPLKTFKTNEELVNAEQARLTIELLQEECLALKARLDTVQQERSSDFEIYKRMLDQVKKVFQDACKTQPPLTVGSRSTMTI